MLLPGGCEAATIRTRKSERNSHIPYSTYIGLRARTICGNMWRVAQGCGAPLCTSVALTHVASKIKDMGAKVHAIDRRLAMQ